MTLKLISLAGIFVVNHLKDLTINSKGLTHIFLDHINYDQLDCNIVNFKCYNDPIWVSKIKIAMQFF